MPRSHACELTGKWSRSDATGRVDTTPPAASLRDQTGVTGTAHDLVITLSVMLYPI